MDLEKLLKLEELLEACICSTYKKDGMKLTCLYIDLSSHFPSDCWYLTTDWHLWIKDRKATVNGFHPVHCRDNCEQILKQYEDDGVNNFIFLGDLVDDEFYQQFTKQEAEAIFDEMFSGIKNKNKYMILGNNDSVKYKSLYEKYGFTVVDALLVNGKYLLTHCPINIRGLNANIINIHGHQHGHGFYWTVPYTNHLDIWSKERTPIVFTKENIDELASTTKHIDISMLNLKSKKEFIAYRGKYKTDDEI